MAVDDYVSKNPPGGSSFGQSTTEKISFYGVTPIVQRSGAQQATIATITPTQTSPFGFSTSAMLISLVAKVDEIGEALRTLGLWKGSA